MKYFLLYIILLAGILSFTRCEREDFIEDSNAKLEFSLDTVFFDTVFTTIGSTTQALKIYNRHNKSIMISEIYLAGGNNSVFRLNIDGLSSRHIKNKKIGPKDSLFIFIEVTVSPNGGTLPMVIKDSIVFITNNNFQDIKLMAWGQDMYYFKSQTIETETWDNDKPYLIYNYLLVDSNHVLTINEGVRVYLHWNSSLVIYGKLIINGTTEDPVIFQGDRLEPYYQETDVNGQWGTIAIVNGSKGSIINNVIIKNPILGFQFGDVLDERTVQAKISNTKIINTSSAGIYAYGAELDIFNTVIEKCDYMCMAGLRGGKYNFYHCSFINNGEEPGILLSNYVECTKKVCDTAFLITNDLEANFYNSIVYRDSYTTKNELLFSRKNESNFNYKFDHCLLTLNEDSFDVNNTSIFIDNLINIDPKIKDYPDDLELDTLSPVKDKAGKDIISQFPELELDIKGNSRIIDDAPDIGAYERIENE